MKVHALDAPTKVGDALDAPTEKEDAQEKEDEARPAENEDQATRGDDIGWWRNAISSALYMVGPCLVIVAIQIFRGNITMANKLGLQRMRTQRMLKRTLVTLLAFNATFVDDEGPPPRNDEAHRSLSVIEEKHRGFRRGASSRQLRSRLKRIDRLLDTLHAALDNFELALFTKDVNTAWTALDAAAADVVQHYSHTIHTFDGQQSALAWSVVALNTCAWILMAKLASETARIRKRVNEATLQTMAERESADRHRLESEHQRFQQEVLDHRFGNCIRMARLFLEMHNLEDLETILSNWELEVYVRQQKLSSLPADPISAKDLFRTPFNFHHTVECFAGAETPLLFYNDAGAHVPYAILQVAFLTDCASNIVKHGGAAATAVVHPDKIQVSNKIVSNRNLMPSNKMGLRALTQLGVKYGIPVDSHAENKLFTLTLHVKSKAKQRNSSETCSSFSSDDDTTKAPDCLYFLIEDSKTLATLTQKQYKRYGLDVLNIVEPEEVWSIEAIIMKHYNQKNKPIVCICDENIFSLDDHYAVVPETGTQLRQKLLASPKIKDLYDQHQLVFISCSASVVQDPTVILVVTKAMPPKHQVNIIRKALWDFFS